MNGPSSSAAHPGDRRSTLKKQPLLNLGALPASGAVALADTKLFHLPSRLHSSDQPPGKFAAAGPSLGGLRIAIFRHDTRILAAPFLAAHLGLTRQNVSAHTVIKNGQTLL